MKKIKFSSDDEIRTKLRFFYISFIFLELFVIFIILSLFVKPVLGGVGTNVTVITRLDVGNVYPEVIVVDINSGDSNFILNPNSTSRLTCTGLLRDYNNDTDITNVSAYWFHNSTSESNGSDDNNLHYTNASCSIVRSYAGNFYGVPDDDYMALGNCTFDTWFYADPGVWNCTLVAVDSTNWNATNSSRVNLNSLLAIGLPDDMSYGTVNSTYVSGENYSNVTNVGNTKVNLSLYGYARYVGDNLAMNCTQGATKNISVEYEGYNLTMSTGGAIPYSQFNTYYTNLSGSPVVKKFDLEYRRNDNYNEAVNATYWRIFVPIGVAGSCQGNIVFGATTATGT